MKVLSPRMQQLFRKQRRRLVPHPVTSIVLLATWLLLNDTLAPGHLLLGGVMGVAIPIFTRRFWRDTVEVSAPGAALRLAGVVAKDIIVSCFLVAGRVLGRGGPVRPGFVKVPLDVTGDFAVTALASIVSLTPGTVSADVDERREYLLVHVLDADDEDALISEIKLRYEAPLKEILP